MDLDFISEHFPRLLKATKLTIELTSLSLFFGIFVGVFFAILRTSKNKILFFISYYYSYILFSSLSVTNFPLGNLMSSGNSFKNDSIKRDSCPNNKPVKINSGRIRFIIAILYQITLRFSFIFKICMFHNPFI